MDKVVTITTGVAFKACENLSVFAGKKSVLVAIQRQN
jgi:hypothetical protein